MKYLKIVFLFFILIFFTFKYFAHKNASTTCTILTNLKFYDSESSNYISGKSLLINGAVITNIFESTNLEYNNSCKVVDLNSAFVFPGLIDAHTHLLSLDSQKVTSWKQALQISAAKPTMMRLFIGEKNAKSMLYEGFTTVRDLGNSGNFLDKELNSRITQNISVGPEIIFSGPGITISPSQIDLKVNPYEYTIISNTSEVDAVLKKYIANDAAWVKIYADNSINENLISQELLSTLIQKAKEHKLKVAVHSEFSQSALLALQAQANSIEHFYEAPDRAPVSMPTSPYIVITDFSLDVCNNLNFQSNCNQKILSLKERLNWLKLNSYKIVFGSDGVLDFSSRFKSRGELSMASLLSLSQYGLSNREIIAAATSTAADMLELPSGRIGISKTADLIALSSDPLIDLNNLKSKALIMSKGNIVCLGVQGCSHD